MKILIIASPRSGSTTLFNALYKSLDNYKGFCEPFNSKSESLGDPINEYSLNYDNLIVKLLSIDFRHLQNFQIELIGNLYAHNYIDIESIKDFYLPIVKNYTSFFDKIVFLTRENQQEASQSFSYSATTGEYHKKYNYDNEYFDFRSKNIIKNHSKMVEYFSKSLNIPLFFYEDLFNNTKSLLDFLDYYQFPIKNLDNFLEYFKSKYRYRQN